MLRRTYFIRVEGMNPHRFVEQLIKKTSPFYEPRMGHASVAKHASENMEDGGIIEIGIASEEVCQFSPEQRAFLNRPYVMEMWHGNSGKRVEL